MPQWQPDLVLSGGDAIAGQKASLTKAQINAMWAAFDRHVAAPLREYGVPFGFTIGNHDGSGAIKDRTLIFKQERDLAQAYWQQQQDRLGLNIVDRANFPFYYSFKQKDIFFLVWDASTDNISQAAAKLDRTGSSKSRSARGSRKNCYRSFAFVSRSHS